MIVLEGYERLLTVADGAKLLGTTQSFPRRLLAQRRSEFVKVTGVAATATATATT